MKNITKNAGSNTATDNSHKLTTKDMVLELLKENSCNYISGQEIADRLFLTRAAVWKSIKALQDMGHDIEAVTNRGYRLNLPSDSISASAIKALLSDGSDTFASTVLPDIIVFDEVASTNNTARELALTGNQNDTVIIADSQTMGRGRRGRSFYSPKGTGLYMSFLLYPELTLTDAVRLTSMTAVAAMDAIKETLGTKVSIKWVNDLYLQDKKIAGILSEAFTSIEDGSLSYVVIGIGINLYPPRTEFPKELKDIAGVLCPQGAEDSNLRNKLAAALISSFFRYYRNPMDSPFVEKYREASNLIGHYVKINPSQPSAQQKYAFVTGIDDSCRLMVKYDNGTEESLSSGEVSVVKY